MLVDHARPHGVPRVVADVFREVYKALKETADSLPEKGAKTGF